MATFKVELIPTGHADETHGWSVLRHRMPAQNVLHNELVKKIFQLRDQLETATPEMVTALQSEIKAHRSFLGLIHRNDPLDTK